MILSPASESKFEFRNKYFEHYARKWNKHLHMLYAVAVWRFYTEFKEKTCEGLFCY